MEPAALAALRGWILISLECLANDVSRLNIPEPAVTLVSPVIAPGWV